LDASFAIAHREKLIDFAYRAVHEMTVKSKLVIETYYRRPPTFSYWDGCSDGGAQAFSEATRYPADYNGIIAGAPPTMLTHLTAAAIWRRRAIESSAGSLVPPSKLAFLHGPCSTPAMRSMA
jgi:Tannase and feruloyl esterase.